MHLEIERKFLVANGGWRVGVAYRRQLRDGLVSQGENGKVRVRIDGEHASLTIKGARQGISRPEFEYEIPIEDAEFLLANICTGQIIEKERHYVPYAGLIWEVDVFSGALQGLVWAELELDREDQLFERPDWVGREVTNDPRFRHSSLLRMCGCVDQPIDATMLLET